MKRIKSLHYSKLKITMNYQTQILKTSYDEEDKILILSPLMKTYLSSLPDLITFNNLQTHNFIESDLDEQIEMKRENDYLHLSNDEFDEIENDLRDEIINDLEKEIEILYSLF